jgi:TolB-like protein
MPIKKEASALKTDPFPSEVQLGSLGADIQRGCLIGPDGQQIWLRPKTWNVLRHLIRNVGSVVSRADLLETVWPEVFVSDDSLTQCIAELRKALDDSRGDLIRTVPRRGYLLELEGIAKCTERSPSDVPTHSLRPVLAVLPFLNLSGGRRLGRLCDGLAEDMITDLARHPDLRVIARTSSFAWRDRVADIREIGRSLGANYLLEGSVQSDSQQVNVTAQLIERETGEHVWAGRYSRVKEGVFLIQQEVVGRVAGALAGFGGAIARAELVRVRRVPPANLHAYELYLLGYEQEARLDREGTLRGIQLLEAAVAADPTLSRAWTVLGFTYGNAVGNGWGDNQAALRARQQEAIRRAVDLDPGDPIALEELGAMLARRGDLVGARDALERAAEVGSNHADTMALLGKYMVEVLGHFGAAERMMHRSFELNPFCPNWYYLGAARVAYFTGNFAQAVDFARLAPPLRLPKLIHLLSLAKLDRNSEFQSAKSQFFQAFGSDAVKKAMASMPPLCTDAAQMLDEGLRKADLAL